MYHVRAAVAAALFLVSGAMSLAAAPVTLASPDGGISVTGEFLSFDGEFFRLDVPEVGVVTLDGGPLACTGEACPARDAFVAQVGFSGARRMGEVLMPALVESFALRRGYTAERVEAGADRLQLDLTDPAAGRVIARFTFHLVDTDEGVADFLAGEAEIVMALREVLPAEVEFARSAGVEGFGAPRLARIVGLDAIVPLVSAASPLRDISMTDLARLYGGRGMAGASGDPVTLHLGPASDGLTQAFARRAAQSRPVGDAVVRHPDLAAVADAVARDPMAVGIGSFANQGNAVPLRLIGPCGYPAEATDRSLKTEDYPLTTPLFLYLPPWRLPEVARDFVDFAVSPGAQPVVRRTGFVDQFPQAIPLDSQGARFANAIARAGGDTGLDELQGMVAALDDRARLSVTFRFEDGSSRLDAQSRSNVALLAQALNRGVFADRSLLFVGFSDGVGPAATNRRLARARAETVRAAVSKAAAEPLDDGAQNRLDLRIASFGEAMPMACDEVEWGRRINRRVEVWLD
ncbi:cell envelope biogenesis protein OmpA [Mesobaculum littorinae]|uniref:Cell envelope biogenesis protein OmpA n=1 Tax=Mesobaculum littorinae TaxID=2486419 RepID=A0A438AGN3_9RHOB|nr:phosphate ABC transporter substrate-binding/OmpA family protein [Mesobaculum littorinae]RVV97871.1 cell envelope biogenesis protein OmpA [Mesobaculum littorinae]